MRAQELRVGDDAKLVEIEVAEGLLALTHVVDAASVDLRISGSPRHLRTFLWP